VREAGEAPQITEHRDDFGAWLSSNASWSLASTSSATCGAKNRFRRTMRSDRSCERASSPAISLNRVASTSSSSPVAMSISWSK